MSLFSLALAAFLPLAPQARGAEPVSFGEDRVDVPAALRKAKAASVAFPDVSGAPIAKAQAPRPKPPTNFSHDATPAEIKAAVERNADNHLPKGVKSPFRPVEDTAAFAYVLMSAYEQGSEVPNLRKTIASNLPAGVRLVILADADEADRVRKKYLKWLPAERLIIATDEYTGNGFWARDAFPVPVYDDSSKKASLVAAHYYRDFTSWDAVASSVNGPIAKKGFTFVGGNLLADEDGTCFAIDSYRLFTVTPQDLTGAYGCKTVHIMPHVHGIGDVDEVLKPLPGKRMLTNTVEYKESLESWGYQLVWLPHLKEAYRTYANALIVRDTVFMPAYNVPADQEARQVFESLGYQVFPIPTVDLSDDLHGSIHCQTMAYPPMPKQALLKALRLVEL
ncbi:MAG: agmatine deiminase family protein [Elusimicrobia bacterium]|nr:agmatine deiminase family protein [Elusimicrobiota bacterium]